MQSFGAAHSDQCDRCSAGAAQTAADTESNGGSWRKKKKERPPTVLCPVGPADPAEPQSRSDRKKKDCTVS